MGMGEWLATFRALHEHAKRGTLDAEEKQIYDMGRDELARVLMAAQRATVKPGEKPRESLRVSRALQVDLFFPAQQVRGATIDISSGGFGVVLGARPPAGESKFSLRLPGQDPVVGVARLVNSVQQPGSVRASFAFVGLPKEEAARVEFFVFDVVMAQFQR